MRGPLRCAELLCGDSGRCAALRCAPLRLRCGCAARRESETPWLRIAHSSSVSGGTGYTASHELVLFGITNPKLKS